MVAEDVVREIMQPISRLDRDVRNAADKLSKDEVRFLVDNYYIWQEQRKRSNNQIRALTESKEPHEAIQWLSGNAVSLEHSVKTVLDAYTRSKTLGKWSRSVVGIGPVIAAGLMAHIDITRAPTVGHIWSFAGLNPEAVWEKGQKRPWNASLKTLCWKMGESFVKVQNREGDVYGQIYAERKEQEIARNEGGHFREQAAAILEKKKIGKDTDAYKAYSIGKLPPAHIHARAKRYAVKLYLAHWHHVAYELEYGKEPPKPYVLTQDGHTHYIAPPGWPLAA